MTLPTRGDDLLRELEERARECLPRGTYDWIAGGAAREETLRRNMTAWGEVEFRPDALLDVSAVEVATELLGQPVSHPVGVAPSGFQALSHSEGERATARGTASSGGLFVLSSRCSYPLEQIAPTGPWWFQSYVMRDRKLTGSMVQRASRLGASAIVLTVDAPVLSRRRHSRDTALVSLEALQVNTGPVTDPTDLEPAPDLGPGDIKWLQDISGLPVVVKGVLRSDTALRCVSAGAAGVWVSNHGGRQLDGAVSTVDGLSEIAPAIGEAAEVYVDGGVRSGADVARALSLGAKAVFVGRPIVWGLAVDGEAGVRRVLDELVGDLELTLRLLGRQSINDIAGDLITPRRK